MSESNIAEKFLYAAITTVTQTPVYVDAAPPGTELPVIIFQQQSGRDVMTGDANRLFTEFIYIVKKCDKTSYQALEADLDLIDAALHKQLHVGIGTPTAGGVLSCIREGTLQMSESTSTGTIYHRGAYYRIRAKVD